LTVSPSLELREVGAEVVDTEGRARVELELVVRVVVALPTPP
jgi:hypothetical protein